MTSVRYSGRLLRYLQLEIRVGIEYCGVAEANVDIHALWRNRAPFRLVGMSSVYLYKKEHFLRLNDLHKKPRNKYYCT